MGINVKLAVSWSLVGRTSLGRCRQRRELCKWATCHLGNLQKREERGDEKENEIEVPFVTHVKARGSLLPLPLQQLWTPSFLLALTGVTGTPIQLHTGFQLGMD